MIKKLINADCMDIMKDYPDNYFDLAIVDPEYRDNNQPTQQMRKNGNMKKWRGKPKKEYFIELFRISIYQIIWGGNYFTSNLNENNNWIVWYKNNAGTCFSMCELAWCSIKKNIQMIDIRSPQAIKKENKIHPTQKPVVLYKWLLTNYAKPGDKIIDTHLGSGSSAIAAHYFDCEFTGIEIDKEYFEDSKKRIEMETKQLALI